jgi:hypothetical protein
MAKEITGNPWVFDTATEGEGYGPNADSVSVNFNTWIYIKRIKVYTGTSGGDVQVDDRKTSGREILFLDNTFANDSIECPMGIAVKGVYIKTLPTAAKVYVYHGK